MQLIEVEQKEATTMIRLSRPPANALNPALVQALTAAVADAPASGVRGIVLSGAPGMFSAGLDLPE
jgi:enoyl-CoA hydratase/carnithine racemase